MLVSFSRNGNGERKKRGVGRKLCRFMIKAWSASLNMVDMISVVNTEFYIYFIYRDHIFSRKVCPFVLTNSRLQISLKDFSLFCPSLQFSEALCQNLDFLYKHLEFLHINDPHFQYPSADRLVIINIAVF